MSPDQPPVALGDIACGMQHSPANPAGLPHTTREPHPRAPTRVGALSLALALPRDEVRPKAIPFLPARNGTVRT